MHATTISCSVALFLIILLIVLVRKHLNGLLKDQSTLTIDLAPYSLARTVMFFWTMLVLLSVCYIGIVTNNLVPITNGVLILMGIVVGTTVVGKTIDSTQSNTAAAVAATPPPAAVTTPPPLIQNMPTEGFLTDILSDRNGISISRLQTVIFNIIYGCFFITYVIDNNLLYDFPQQTLALLGISSGAYALMKIPENN